MGMRGYGVVSPEHPWLGVEMGQEVKQESRTQFKDRRLFPTLEVS